MNILVLSDSHGNISNMEEAVEREKPDMILHLGDCWRDAERLAERYPDIPMDTFPEIVTAVRRSRRKNCCF